MPEGEVKVCAVDVNALAERAESSRTAKMEELEELLARRGQLEKEIEGGSYFCFRTADQISAGWDAFYRVKGQIEDTELIIHEYSQQRLELSSVSERQEEQMREISRQTQIPERGAGVARSESQVVILLFDTGRDSTAQKQPQQQQQQTFGTEGQDVVVDAGKAKVEFETGEKRWLQDFVVKLKYEQCLSCSVGAPAAEPVDVWARVGVGTRWLVAVEDAGGRRHEHPGGESFPPFARD